MQRFFRQTGWILILNTVIHGAFLLSIHRYGNVLHDQTCKSLVPRVDRDNDKTAIILSGSSTIANGINPQRIGQECNYQVVNIAEPANSPTRNYFTLLKIIRPGDIVVQSFDPWIYLERYASIHDERVLNQSLSAKASLLHNTIKPRSLISIIQTHYASIVNYALMRIDLTKSTRIEQYSCLNRSYQPDTRLVDFFAQPKVDLHQAQKLAEIKELCSNVGAEFILVYPPKSQRYLAESARTEHLLSTTIKTIELPEPLTYDSAFLADDFHLNCQGNTKYTKYLLDLINKENALQQP